MKAKSTQATGSDLRDAVIGQINAGLHKTAAVLARKARNNRTLRRLISPTLRRRLRTWFAILTSFTANESERIVEAAASSIQKTILIVDHALGGGANLYRRQLMEKYSAEGHPILILTYEYRLARMRLDFSFQDISATIVPASLHDVVHLSFAIPLGEVFYNNAVSYADPLAVVDVLRLIRRNTGSKLTVTFHDYFPVCPSFNLINSQGRFCGLPDKADICNHCLANMWHESIIKPDGGISRWRSAWSNIIAEADEALFFSEATARLVRKVYPHVGSKEVVRPHRVDYLPPRKPKIDVNSTLHVGVFGNIGYAKGAAVVRGIAECIARRGLKARITVVGTLFDECRFSCSEPLPATLHVTGPYRTEELADIIEREKINVCFLPSIWPETFSYVTDELMQLKVPMCCFDLGAPAERVRTYSLGMVFSSNDDPGVTLEDLVAFHQDLRASASNDGRRHGVPAQQHQGDIGLRWNW